MAKTRINVSLDPDLAEFAKVFAAENRTSVAEIFTQYLLALKRHNEGEQVQHILSHPAFEQAMEAYRYARGKLEALGLEQNPQMSVQKAIPLSRVE